MRVALVVPDRRDPAHAAVLRGLGAALRARGHAVSAWSGHERGLARRLRGAEVAHLHVFSRRWAGLAGLAAPGGPPLVLTHQGASLAFTDDAAVLAALLGRARRVTAVSRAGLRELLRVHPGVRRKASVVPNGAPVGPAPRRRSDAGLLSVGRVAAYKGLDILALALARLREEGLSARWTVVGPDQTGGRFARFVERLGLTPYVRLTGALPPARVRALMAGCGVFVQPSRAEGLPMALLEAMAAGAPVLAADAGGCREAVRAGRDGLLAAPGEPEALARALRRLLGDGALRRRLGAAAKRRSCDFTWAKAAAAYERIY
ncbi:MAG: glycosyltransferase [Elusimicrobia bacterium]|nr:glycosyltransferase [Elusimicrobiota bacterium]